MIDFPCPLLGICAFSGTGKTTLLRRLIPLLRRRGLRTGLVKHAHHRFELDYPGKDSYELRKAGASQVVVASRTRLAAITEFPEQRRDEPSLAEALAPLAPERLDLVLVEGFKRAPIPKIELHRAALGRPLLQPTDPWVIAVASDRPVDLDADAVAPLDLNRPAEIAAFIVDYFGLVPAAAPEPAGAPRSTDGP
jgi:molybdopterin-guanine dinucleotide biosynthesis protein B